MGRIKKAQQKSHVSCLRFCSQLLIHMGLLARVLYLFHNNTKIVENLWTSLNLSLIPERVRRDGTVMRKCKWTFPGIAEMLNIHVASSCSKCQASEHSHMSISANFFYRCSDYSMCKKNGKWMTVEISSR